MTSGLSWGAGRLPEQAPSLRVPGRRARASARPPWGGGPSPECWMLGGFSLCHQATGCQRAPGASETVVTKNRTLGPPREERDVSRSSEQRGLGLPPSFLRPQFRPLHEGPLVPTGGQSLRLVSLETEEGSSSEGCGGARAHSSCPRRVGWWPPDTCPS